MVYTGGVAFEHHVYFEVEIQKQKMEYEVEINELKGSLEVKVGLVDKLKDDISLRHF